MKLTLLLLVLLSYSATAGILNLPNSSTINQGVTTVVDYLRETPASVMGNISFDETIDLYKTKKSIFDIGLKVNANRGIGFSFSDKHLSVNSNGGMSLTVNGIPIKIKSISYFEQTGKFDVKTELPLGIGEEALNKQIEKVLDEQYRPKIIRAFRELKSLRNSKNLQDINQVVTSISGIFGDVRPRALPTVRGKVELGFFPKTNRTLKIDTWNAEIKKDDSIVAGVEFVKGPNNFSIGAVEMRSYHGIRLSGKTKFPEIASVNFQNFRADRTGITLDYDIGAEEVLTGFVLLMNMVKAYAGHPGNIIQECDPIRLEHIRKSIDGTLKREISNMIRSHRQILLNGGASPQLLAALE